MALLWLLLTAGPHGRTKSWIFQHIDDYADPTATRAAVERMFTRDKTALRNIGVPLTLLSATNQSGQEETYVLDTQRMYLPDIEVSKTELQALHQAQWFWDGSGLQQVAARAIGRVAPADGQLDSVSRRTPTFGARNYQVDKLLSELLNAARQQQIVKFRYRNSNAAETNERKVRVWSVLLISSQWYMVGWDFFRQAQRIFRLTRFEPAKITTVHASPAEAELGLRPEDFNTQEIRQTLDVSSEPAMAELWLFNEGTDSLKIHGEFLTQDDRWQRYRFHYSQPLHFASQVAGLGKLVRIPEEFTQLHSSVVDILSGVVEHHRKPPIKNLPKLAKPRRARNRASETDTIARLLGMVAYINQQGSVSKTELRKRFSITPEQLDKDLTQLQFCGMPERSFMGEQFEVEELGDTVQLYQAEALEGQLQLSATEGLTLLAGLHSIRSVPGIDQSLATAAATIYQKIVAALQESGFSDAVELSAHTVDADMSLGDHHGPATDLHRAISAHQQVDIEYFSERSDASTQRIIEPLRLFYDGGFVYVQAWCTRADDTRNFRVDRIGHLEVLDETFIPRRSIDQLPDITSGPQKNSASPLNVIVWVAHGIRDLLADYAPTRVADLPDGSVVAELVFDKFQKVFQLCAAHPGQFAVVESAEISTQIINHGEQAITGHNQAKITSAL